MKFPFPRPAMTLLDSMDQEEQHRLKIPPVVQKKAGVIEARLWTLYQHGSKAQKIRARRQAIRLWSALGYRPTEIVKKLQGLFEITDRQAWRDWRDWRDLKNTR